MNKVVKLLKSALFWTIIGVLIAVGGLWYAFKDTHSFVDLTIGCGNYGGGEIDADMSYMVFNIVMFDEDAPHAIIVPLSFSPANRSNESAQNVGMRLYYEEGNDYNWRIKDDVKHKGKLHLLPMLCMRNGADVVPVPSGGGFALRELDPFTVAGVDYRREGLFNPVIFDSFSVDDYWKFIYEVELKSDNLKKSRLDVIVYDIPMQMSNDPDVYEKRRKAVRDKITELTKDTNNCVINIVPCYASRYYEVTVDGLLFMVAYPNVEAIESYVIR